MRQDSRLLRFFGELRRRKVLTTLAGYLVVGLGVMEGTEILVPRLGLPDVTVTIVLGVLFAGLPVMLTVSWIYDVSLGGLVRDPGDIEGRSGDGGNPGPVEVERRELDPRAVAVLPFQNLGGNGDDEYFSEGITEEVSAALCRIPTIRVISRTSVVELRSRGATGLRDIGHGLGVGVVVEGSVRRQRNRVRIVARSVDVGTESAIWSETYDREVEDIFEVQSDVAGRVAEAMRVGLDPTM
ncbi:MAG TPA: hypothetical protein VJ925_04305, partial [Longimicrobiales bacterium]|nr:hypothetical protein [Longimicrobiales bacterium]